MNLHFDDQSKQVAFSFSNTEFSKRNKNMFDVLLSSFSSLGYPQFLLGHSQSRYAFRPITRE